MEAACQNYEVLVEDKRVGKGGGAGPTNWYETRSATKKNDAGGSGSQESLKPTSYRLSSEIERATDMRKVLEERILDNRVELSLREVLGIAMKEFHDSIVDLVKQKRLLTEPEPKKPVEVRVAHLDDMSMEEELVGSHYMRPHWTRATIETHVRIEDVHVGSKSI